MTRLICFFVSVMCVANRTIAETAFIPGDAFFYTRLTQDFVEESADKDQLTFQYVGSPAAAEGFGGHAGFFTLVVRDVPEEMILALRRTYFGIRKFDGKIEQVWFDDDGTERKRLEMNGLHLFVYSRKFDWSSQRIGLKYNEHWYDLEALGVTADAPKRSLFGVALTEEHAHYVPFVRGAEAVVEDWRGSANVPGLSAIIPTGVSWHMTGPRIKKPMMIAAEEVQLIVLSSEDISIYFERLDDAGFISIDVNGAVPYVCKEGKVVLSEEEPREEKSDEAAGQ